MYSFEIGEALNKKPLPDGTVTVTICYEHGDADFTEYESWIFTHAEHQKAGRFIKALERCSELDERRDRTLFEVEIAPLFDNTLEAKAFLEDVLKYDRVYEGSGCFASFSGEKVTIWKDGQQFSTTLTEV